MISSYIAPHIKEIVKKLQNSGHETYIVGGAIRDAFLNRSPKDYDISTTATPSQIRRIFGGKNTYVIGRRFKIIHLHVGREVVEISTFRKNPPDGKKVIKNYGFPERLIVRDNVFGTAEEDAFRRDFTVNAIFYDPTTDRTIDFTGMGVNDLKDGIVRFIGEPEIRIEEDPVRILRALKLVGQYSFILEKDTEEAIINLISLIEICSKSRLSLELEKILKNIYGYRILKVFRDFGFLKYFLPFLDRQWDRNKAGDYIVQLLKIRSDRILKGIYRNSISVAMALISLPLVINYLNADEEGEPVWDNYHGIECDIRKVVLDTLLPRTFSKRLVASAVNMLCLQPFFYQDFYHKLYSHRSYSHAREVMIIKNCVYGGDPDLPQNWPAKKGKSKRRRKNKR